MQPQPFSLVGDGAGSIFKIFTTAAALGDGHGHQRHSSTCPAGSRPRAWAAADAKGCPKDTWCVKNAGNYRGSMNVTDALATSPNTAFAKLIYAGRRAAHGGHGGQARAAVLRAARAPPATTTRESNESLADFVKRQNLGSFTLGPIEVNALELSNVAATLASGGMWCPPNPIDKVYRPQRQRGRGHHRDLRTGGARGPGQHAGQRDEQGRPGRRHRRRVGRLGGLGPADVGQDRHHRGAPLVGVPRVHQHARRPPTTSTTTPPTPGDLCSFPLRQCGSGNLFGGNEPARTWFTAMKPIANNFGAVALPPTDPRYVDGAPGSRVPSVVGHDPGPGAAAAEGGRLPGRRPGQPGQQRLVVRHGGRARRRAGRRCPARSSPSRSATASRRHRRRRRPVRSPGFRRHAAGDRPDGRRDSRAATDHRAGARPAAATAAATAVIGVRRCAVGHAARVEVGAWRATGSRLLCMPAACPIDVREEHCRRGRRLGRRRDRLRVADRAQCVRGARGDHAGADAGVVAAAGAAHQRYPHAAQAAAQAGVAA